MNKVFLQVWVESVPGKIERDGCSIHLDQSDRLEYLRKEYSGRNSSNIPECYEMALGEAIEAFVGDDLFKIVSIDKSIRIEETSLRNLLTLDEITIKL